MSTAPIEPVAGGQPPPGHLRRSVPAAGVGVAAAAGSLLAARLLLHSAACRNAPDFGCLGFAVLWPYLWLLPTFLLSWAALYALRIRPAWLTALLGTALGVYLVQVVTVVRGLATGAEYVQLLWGAVAFGLAAWFTRLRTRTRGPLWRRAAVALGLVLLVPLNSTAATQAARSSLESRLADAGVPLLGPHLPEGYHLEGVGIEAPMGDEGPTFYYRVSPDSPGKGATTMAQMQQEIQVFVGPVQPGFTPPSHCTALTSGWPVPSPPCTPVAPGVWRHANYQYVMYFARVGDAVAVLQATSPPVSDTFLGELATTMQVRAPSYFTGG
ncbi:hypothetical protein [Peterkaempfera griseoplana]|uniref:hypothetical protein n=1 Tax=Peterkaempfera griseoplana TaxID=66896 RepID=UPI0012FF27E3|nr:hypothetical protein [Peterkaempfera griseoplana]